MNGSSYIIERGTVESCHEFFLTDEELHCNVSDRLSDQREQGLQPCLALQVLFAKAPFRLPCMALYRSNLILARSNLFLGVPCLGLLLWL